MKSFRIESSLAASLSKTTQQKNVTESTYISDLLQRMLKIEPLAQNIGGIALSESLFRELIAQTNITALELMAYEDARSNVSYLFELLELEHCAESVDWFMKEVLGSWGWFRIRFNSKDGAYRVEMFHNFGLKWSLFLKSYMFGVYETILHQKPIITIREKVVILDFANEQPCRISDPIVLEASQNNSTGRTVMRCNTLY